jgi:hypothetical protein
MLDFWIRVFSIFLGYKLNELSIKDGDVVVSCPDGCSECTKYNPRRSGPGDDMIFGYRHHKPNSKEPIHINKTEPASNLYDILLGIWKRVIPLEYRKSYNTVGEINNSDRENSEIDIDRENSERGFNRFLNQYIRHLTNPPEDEKDENAPIMKGTYNMIQAIIDFNDALNKASVSKGPLRDIFNKESGPSH